MYDTVVDFGQLPGVDQMISTRLQLSVENKVKLCFVCSGTPFFYLFVGRTAKTEWLSSDEALIARSDKDPPFIPRHKLAASELDWTVHGQVVVFEGRSPSAQDPVWTSGASRVAWIDVTGRGKVRAPKDGGWNVYRRSISHASLGGVTDAIFSCFLVSRLQGDCNWRLVATGIRATLRQVIDPTKGGRTVQIPAGPGNTEVEMLNTAGGLLQWTKRFGKVIVPTVYSKELWAERRLTVVELADVLDLPGTLRKRLSLGQLTKVREMSVPGKVVVALFESLKALDNAATDSFVAVVSPGGRGSREENLKRKAEGGDIQGSLGKKKHRKDTVTQQMENSRNQVPTGVDDRSEGMVGIERETLHTVSVKATKSDDAPAPIHLFDDRIFKALGIGNAESVEATTALEVLRRFSLRVWKRKVRSSFSAWLRGYQRSTEGLGTVDQGMIRAGWDACRRADGASCWDWDVGSALLFWRWPEAYQRESWEGVAPRFVAEAPTSKSPQPAYDDEEVRKKVSLKLQKVLDRRYIEVVPDIELASYMYMFDVPKGDSDVRIVYDGSKSGFNDATWAPWFALPTVETMSRTILPSGWCGDRDFGEMFLNFPLHPLARMYCGVDLSKLSLGNVERVEKNHFVGRWTRNAMGLKSSPYLAVQAATRVKRKFLGDQFDSDNPFNWIKCILNLPGSVGYNPTMPWIRKVRGDGLIATDLHIYVDDVRITGTSQELVWNAGSRVAKLCCFYGLQDAPRKLREPSQEPGAWAGSVVATSKGIVTKFVTKERWQKTQGCIRWLATKIGVPGDQWSGTTPEDEDSKKAPVGYLPFKQAERIRGFLIYVSRTYKAMVPYLKGLHLTLDSWRPNRDEEGWRLRTNEEPEDLLLMEIKNAPRFVQIAPRLDADVKVLMDLTGFDEAPAVHVRPSSTAAAYLVGDASGSGFGDCLWVDGEDGLDIAFGSWDGQLSSESSNFREGYNLVLRLEELLKSGKVKEGTELWLFTDNAVSESAFNKGSSKSKLLHGLCARVRKAEMGHSLHVHVVWIAGTRMISQGTDGLSRGDLTSGVMAGDDFLSHIPLDKGHLRDLQSLKNGLKSRYPNSGPGLKLEQIGFSFHSVTRWDVMFGPPSLPCRRSPGTIVRSEIDSSPHKSCVRLSCFVHWSVEKTIHESC
jgi:hypothetical protein